MHAPAAMWARKKEENAHENAFVNPSRFDVKRPMVLVVDDDKQIQQVAIGVILGRGYGVVVANNGEEGFELAREYRPELILTDALMPKLDGREMTRQLKDDWLTSSSRVVIMTSLYTGGRYKYEAMKQFGADDYVAKPLSTEKLSEILKKHLG
jgi:CheY-like chemotaxis protein